MSELSPNIQAFVAKVKAEAEQAFAALWKTGTLAASATVNFVERIPGEDKVVAVGHPNLFGPTQEVKPAVFDFSGALLQGDAKFTAGGARYLPIFRARDDITTVSHVHTPYLGAWSQSHRNLPLLYVASQRHTLARELPNYIDRRQDETDYILEQLAANSHLPAILEANGGATVWGRNGLLKTAEYILLLEEGARLQTLAESIGGSKDYGPGVLEQQWRRTGLWQIAAA